MTSAGDDFVRRDFSLASLPLVTLLNNVIPTEINPSTSPRAYDTPAFKSPLAAS